MLSGCARVILLGIIIYRYHTISSLGARVPEQGRIQDFSQGWAPSDGLVLECY